MLKAKLRCSVWYRAWSMECVYRRSACPTWDWTPSNSRTPLEPATNPRLDQSCVNCPRALKSYSRAGKQYSKVWKKGFVQVCVLQRVASSRARLRCSRGGEQGTSRESDCGETAFALHLPTQPALGKWKVGKMTGALAHEIEIRLASEREREHGIGEARARR